MSTVAGVVLAYRQTMPQERLPARIQQMVDVLLANQAIICQYSSGHLELHYHLDELKTKITVPLKTE